MAIDFHFLSLLGPFPTIRMAINEPLRLLSASPTDFPICPDFSEKWSGSVKSCFLTKKPLRELRKHWANHAWFGRATDSLQ